MAAHSVILPGESHGQRSPVGCGPQGRKELDMTGATEPTSDLSLLLVIFLLHFIPSLKSVKNMLFIKRLIYLPTEASPVAQQ